MDAHLLEVFFPFLPTFPILAVGTVGDIPCRPFLRWCVAPSCVGQRVTRLSRNGGRTTTSR